MDKEKRNEARRKRYEDKREERNAARRKRYREITQTETAEQREVRNAKRRERYSKKKKAMELTSSSAAAKECNHSRVPAGQNLSCSQLESQEEVVGDVMVVDDAVSNKNSTMGHQKLQQEISLLKIVEQGAQKKRKTNEMSVTEIGNSSAKGKESVRMRNKINKMKVEFAKANDIHSFGPPNCVCRHCGAITWSTEQTKKQQQENAWGFTICCGEGKVELPYLKETPPELQCLLDGTDGKSGKFRTNIRVYNLIFSFTSMAGQIDEDINDGQGPFVFRLSGQTYHLIGSLLPEDEKKPRFAQLYMFDATDVDGRMNSLSNPEQVESSIVQSLQQMMDRDNELAKIFHNVRERFSEDDYIPVRLRLLANRTTDGRDTNIPTNAYEFAALIPTENLTDPVDIIVDHRRSGLKRISNVHPSYMALQYPLLFPYGEDGFRPNILHRGLTGVQPNKKNCVSLREYYAFRLQYREGEGHTVLKGGRLLLQYVVDAWTCIENARIMWVLNNQAILRSELYNNIMDAVSRGDTCPLSIGKRIVLPPSFIGGPRYLQQNYHDALAVCRKYGHPDLFITFTCNPKWPEVDEYVKKLKNTNSTVHPEAITRVFYMKLEAMLEDLQEKSVLGRVIALVYTIEFQKRGLPHAHIVLWLADADKCETPQDVDLLISAELPDEKTDPLGYQSVAEFMIHGPCGELNPDCPCMRNGDCSKHFPKDFQSQSHVDENGYPLYKRRDDGRKVHKSGVDLDNRYVVPYNRGLVVKYQAHINVEWCNRALSIKYLFKYIAKGADRATISIERTNKNEADHSVPSNDTIDEVKRYLACRYVSSAEACWRIFKFPIHYRTPYVQRLYFHLEGEQEITYREHDTLPYVARTVDSNGTMLIQWLRANMETDEGHHLTFVEFPKLFRWDKDAKMWFRRQRRIDVVGRLIYAHPASGEKFYLRMLLNVVKGAMSFEDIRTVNGIQYGTYKEACYHRGLLESDNEWHQALNDAARFQTGQQLRELFVTMLLFCEVGDVCKLWEEHWQDLADDIQYMQRSICGMPFLILSDEQKQAMAIYEIDLLLKKNGKSLEDFPTLPSVDPDLIAEFGNRLLQEELSYDRCKLAEESNQYIQLLNVEQRQVYNAVMESIENGSGGMFFVYGHGGTGKTFLWQTIISKLRSEGEVVLAVASSGIASLLIEGGRTAHSRLKIPIQIDEHSSCDIRQKTMLADLLCRTVLVVWDEAPMAHRHIFEAVDRTFRDILRKVDPMAMTKPFGGKSILLGGDFRQILPVMPKKGREDIVMASINKSPLWRECKLFKLFENMRIEKNVPPVTVDGQKIEFRKWVVAVGDGNARYHRIGNESEPSWIEIPKELQVPSNGDAMKSIVDIVYGQLRTRYDDIDYLRDRAILTPMNEDVDKLNAAILELLPGDIKVYKSSDTICKGSTNFEDHEVMYPSEFLNSMRFNGIPNHELQLKVGAPIMLLRNTNPSKGMCNGTRLIITQLTPWMIEGRIITGSHIGRKVFISRIIMSPTDSSLPFVFRRRQFPVALCYAMTINKSQGQTLKSVGLFLKRPVFSHGQLYVAISRVTSPDGLKIVVEEADQETDGYTKNIVYKEVFKNL